MKCHRNTDVKVPIIPLPEDILLHYKDIKLYIDLFYINEIPFLYKKVPRPPSSQQKNRFKERRKDHQKLHKIANIYTAICFNIGVYHGDNEFDINGLREHISPES